MLPHSKFIFTTFTLAVLSISTSQQASAAISIQFTPPLPPDVGEPNGRAQGGGSRGDCLTALVPKTRTASGQEILWGLTTSDRPTVWFHTSRGLSRGIPVEWMLQDKTGKPIYKTRFKASATPPGVMSFSIPSTAAPLQIGQSYYWTLSTYCAPLELNSSTTPEDIDRPIVATLHGVIKRVTSPTLQSQIASAKTPVEQASLYANRGVWYDALTTLGNHLQATPKDLTIASVWAELLQQVHLEISASFTPCCTAK